MAQSVRRLAAAVFGEDQTVMLELDILRGAVAHETADVLDRYELPNHNSSPPAAFCDDPSPPLPPVFVRWNALECARVCHKLGHKLTARAFH